MNSVDTTVTNTLFIAPAIFGKPTCVLDACLIAWFHMQLCCTVDRRGLDCLLLQLLANLTSNGCL